MHLEIIQCLVVDRLNMIYIEECMLFMQMCIPVTIVSDGSVSDGWTWADVSAQQTVYGAAQPTENRAFVEAIHDEDGSLDHHDKIADGQV